MSQVAFKCNGCRLTIVNRRVAKCPQCGKQIDETRNYLKFATERRPEIIAKYHEIWDRLFSSVSTESELEAWERELPPAGCKCKKFYASWKLANPPQPLDFEWKWRLKSAVNEKLGKDNFELDEAKVVLGIDDHFNNTTREDIVAVTSLSPKRHSAERQLHCIGSWERFGLRVFARNTSAEIKILRPKFPTVNWIVDEETCDGYAYPTQKIRNLARTAIEIDCPVLLINSDCELRGKSNCLTFGEKMQFVGVRWNFEPSYPHVVSEFRWGLDAFSFTPAQAALIPVDFPYAIGHAMWDYAVPALMVQNKIDLNILHTPFLFHENHPVNWSRDDWHRGQQWLRNRLNVGIEYSNSEFRDGLERGWRYSQTRWVRSEV